MGSNTAASQYRDVPKVVLDRLPPLGSPPTVFFALIIDADAGAILTIKQALSPFEFEFIATSDVREAMRVARMTPPDIIFLRVELPNASGFSVCNKLRRNDETKYVPLVLYASAIPDEVFNQHRLLETHADTYLQMPLDGRHLVSAVKALFPIEPESRQQAPPNSSSLPG